MPRGNGEEQGPLRGRVVLLLPSILQENNPEGGAGKMQISGKKTSEILPLRQPFPEEHGISLWGDGSKMIGCVI